MYRESIEIIEIRFKNIEMHLPESRDAIAQARKLLDLFEETLPKPKNHKPEPEKSTIPISASAPDVALDEYNFKECEKFDHSNLSAHKAGKSTYWLSDDAKRVCIEREGYAQGMYVYAAIDDLKYFQAHPDKVYSVLKKFMSYKKYHVTGFLKDVDVSVLSGEQAEELKEPEEQPSESEQHNEPKEPEEPEPEKQKPLTQAFQEDMGFDYRAVQPKWVGKLQVYSNINGKIVIKENKAILLTTNKMIENLLPLDETDLNRCIRSITHEKQKILRNYLTALRARHG